MKLAWLTDLHLDFVGASAVEKLLAEISAAEPQAVLITGDISNSELLAKSLTSLASLNQLPIYFVLGNHDFYHGSMVRVRKSVQELTRELPHLIWLSERSVVKLTSNTALIGHDSRYDLRYGDFRNSQVSINDASSILDLFGLARSEFQRRCEALADEAARHLESALSEAAAAFREVIVAVHVPPFAEVASLRGKPLDNYTLPFYASKVIGETLLRIAQMYPSTQFLVLAGHTHSSAKVSPLPNLRVQVGSAEYGAPKIESFITVS